MITCLADGRVSKDQWPPWIIPDELRARIEPLLPQVKRRYRHPGRKRLDDRKVLHPVGVSAPTGWSESGDGGPALNALAR